MEKMNGTAEYVLEAVKRAGGSDGACTVNWAIKDELVTSNGELSLRRTSDNITVDVKAFLEGAKGTATTNGTDREALDEAVATAVQSARNVPAEGEALAPGVGERTFVAGDMEGDPGALFDRTKEFLDAAKREYPKVSLDLYSAAYNKRIQLFAATNGSRVTSKSGHYTLFPSFSAREGGKVSSFNAFIYNTYRLNQPFMDAWMVRMLIADAQKQIVTRPLEGKRVGTVLMAPPCLYGFLLGTIERCAGDNVMTSGVSAWKDKLGKSVAAGNVSLSLMPLDERIVGADRVTEDGYLWDNFDIVKNGVLKSYALSASAARKIGLERSPCTGRSIMLHHGDSSFEQLISGIEYGILVNRYSGMQPTYSGDFSGVAKNSFLIEKGKLTDAVSESMISGNFFDMLSNAPRIGGEYLCDGSSILPWASFDGVTISGK